MIKTDKEDHSSGVGNSQKVLQVVKSERLKIGIALAVILLITVIVYLPVFHNSLLNWDDPFYIKNNLLIRSFNLKEIFSTYVLGNYHPFTILILAVEYHLFGLNAIGYHGVNLFLHLVNVILVFYTVYHISDKTVVALVASLLFGIHPMHVESVAWAAELKDLLYTLFFLASYIFYLKYLEERIKELKIKELKNMESRTFFHSFILSLFHSKSTSAHQHISTSAHIQIFKFSNFYILALLLFLVSLLSKAMAASLPLVLLLTDYFKGRKINKKILLEKAPFFLLALIFGVVALFAQRSANAVTEITTYLFPQTLIFAAYGYVNYLFKLLLPLNLCAFYPYPGNNGTGIPIYYNAFVLILAALIVYIFYSVRFTKKIIFGMGFFTITILLVLQLLPVGKAIMADRYSYIPSIGIFYLAGEGLMFLWNNKLKWPAILLLSVTAVLFSVKTYARCGVWKNDMIFWNDVIDRYQTIEEAYYNRGVVNMYEKRNEDAIKDFNRALVLDPKYAEAYNNRGNVFLNENKNAEALADFKKALEFKPDYADAYYNLGLLYMNENRNEEAFKDFNKAIELKPDFAAAYNNRGIVFINENKNAEAIKDFSKAIELNPDGTDAYTNRGFVLMNEKRNADAINDFNKAIELDPGNAEAYYHLGRLFVIEKRYTEALNDFNKAVELKPDFAGAYSDRGNLFMNEKRNAEAINDFNKAIELESGNPKAYLTRGIVFVKENRNAEALNDFNKAIELNPDYAAAYTNKANLFFKEKRYEEAISIYSMAIALKTDYAQAYYNRGLAEFYSGKKVAACLDLKKAAGMGYRPAVDALARLCK
jgi:protein O-mannosyl-transferase